MSSNVFNLSKCWLLHIPANAFACATTSGGQDDAGLSTDFLLDPAADFGVAGVAAEAC